MGGNATGAPNPVDCSQVVVCERDAALLSGIDWTVRHGERWVVLGPNGAGKSTLLHLLAGYRLPTRGRVSVLGHRFGRVDLRELRPRIGYSSAALTVPDRPDLTPAGFVMAAKHAQVMPWHADYQATDEERACALLEQFGCGHLAKRRLSTLSEGQRQATQIARALMTQPELLLLDEPVSGLDLGARESLLHRLQRLAASTELAALVLVTHHVEEIPVSFTHGLLLRDGRVFASGPLGEVMTSEALSACFSTPLSVVQRGGRFWATAATQEIECSERSDLPIQEIERSERSDLTT